MKIHLIFIFNVLASNAVQVMMRTLSRLGTKELIAYAQAEANDISFMNCLHEINFRTKAVAAEKFNELIPGLIKKLKKSIQKGTLVLSS